MKKIILIFALALTSVVVNANEKEKDLVKNTDLPEFIRAFQDCEAYANRAARAEVGFWEDFFTNGAASQASYHYWLGYCEGHDPANGELLDPVFL